MYLTIENRTIFQLKIVPLVLAKASLLITEIPDNLFNNLFLSKNIKKQAAAILLFHILRIEKLNKDYDNKTSAGIFNS